MPKTSWWSALFDESKKIQRNKEIQEEALNKNVDLKASIKIEEKVINTLIDSLKKLSGENIEGKIENTIENQSEKIIDNLSELDRKEETLVNEAVDKFEFNIEDPKSQELLCSSNVVKKVGPIIERLTKNISSKKIADFFGTDFIKKILTKKVFLTKFYLKYKKYFDLKGIAKALLEYKGGKIQLRRIGSDIRKILYNGDESAGIDKITGRIAIFGPAFNKNSKNITNIKKNTPKVLKEIKDKFIKEFEKGEHVAREKFNKLLLDNENNISKIFDSYNKNAEVYMYLGVISESNGENEFKDLKEKIKEHLKLTPKTKIPYTTVKNSGESAADIKSKIEKSFKSFTKNSKSKEETKEENEEENY